MNIVISKDKTTILKGVAILFMILHHVFIKEFYIEQPEILSSSVAVRMQIAMKMCVGIYTFIIGYGFWFCKSYSTGYVFGHIGKLLRQYWIVFVFLILPISIWGGYFIDYKTLLLNLFGLEHQYCLGNWYIYFYVYALLLLPLLRRWLEPDGFWRPIVAVALFAIVRYLCAENRYVDNCFAYSQMLVVGLYCAKTQILSHWAGNIKSRGLWLALFCFAVVMRCVSGAMGFTTDVIAVPVVVIAVCGFSQGHEKSLLVRVLTTLGKHSTYMWFIHCIFFSTATKGVIQHLPMWTNFLPVEFLMVSLFSYLLASFMGRIETFIHEKTK